MIARFASCMRRTDATTPSRICSHEDYALSEGELDGYAVECPRHGSCFDIRTGDVLNPPAVLPVATFEVSLTPDEVVIDVAE